MDNAEEWQVSCVSLKSRGQRLLTNGLLTDCKFVFDCEPDQIIIESHKLLLAMASPVFQAMFYGAMAQTDKIDIDDIEPETFKALLMYIYTDEIKIDTIDKAFDLYYVAKKYMILHLARECARFIGSFVIPTNVCQVYDLAKFFNESDLINKCVKVISYFTLQVLSAASFENIKLETMMDIFKLDNLSISNELDLFNAALRYANARVKKIPMVKPYNPISRIENNIKSMEKFSNTALEEKTTNSGTLSLRSVIKNIRFLLLTPKEFAEGPAKSDLLTKDEILTISMKIASPNSDIVMPEGFTTSKESRRIESYV